MIYLFFTCSLHGEEMFRTRLRVDRFFYNRDGIEGMSTLRRCNRETNSDDRVTVLTIDLVTANNLIKIRNLLTLMGKMKN